MAAARGGPTGDSCGLPGQPAGGRLPPGGAGGHRAGGGAEIGSRAYSSLNNPEPEVVLAINRAGAAVGAALGNDVNLRDFEGRSALLLGKAKDNNASASLGPFIRLFDGQFTLETIKAADVASRSKRRSSGISRRKWSRYRAVVEG